MSKPADPDATAPLVHAYLNAKRARNHASSTVANERWQLSRFTRWLAAADIVRLQDVTAAVLERYRSDLRDQGVSFNTVQDYLRAVRSLFGYLLGESLVFEDPTCGMVLSKQYRNLPQVISVAQVGKLLAAPDCSRKAGLRDRALLELLYSTGMRCCEINALSLFDIDLDQATVRVLGKGRKERVLPVGKQAVKYLRAYLQRVRPFWIERSGRLDLTALFISGRALAFGPGRALQIVTWHARKAALAAGVSPHTLRRSCATHMLQNGAHPLAVARMLGHADMKNLSRYLRVTVTELKNMHRRSNPGR